jgi:hypothetical protein
MRECRAPFPGLGHMEKESQGYRFAPAPRGSSLRWHYPPCFPRLGWNVTDFWKSFTTLRGNQCPGKVSYDLAR